jgi:hypothetical protein
LNRWVSNNLVKAAATQNFDGERAGIINKLFAALRNSPCGPTYRKKESIGVLRVKICSDSGHNGDSRCIGLLSLKHVTEPLMGPHAASLSKERKGQHERFAGRRP